MSSTSRHPRSVADVVSSHRDARADVKTRCRVDGVHVVHVVHVIDVIGVIDVIDVNAFVRNPFGAS